ncbi:MAG: hypothetical protein A2784_01770 [Candidatus Chisholmbacteria bacterium RIFCSPHIGHO2_01_FULL_48_12]|uniref:Uncharacterized protein n=3 Tax=Patescibacteria group TaxID=1783273 RepID=A0A1G1VRQ3_9BACT|nr:MAG: hypothetical protein A3F03_04885 [Candidatus Roizmanbacteria bacterium RIFCSPHIGHO2_12_FULL_41_11]OGY17907.1 MAG: hypothetical protein A2784_01770 [Candidatus Chisholmbacteria bacterium RIFCSPHIGHO2_01_FULL_48_12]OGZ40440.1 MAG: hypothetical protein A3I20_00960 [Candidatus Portnoybacteria bacterium RIFCSPLOWO2_02_FULL_40_15]
MRKTSDVLNKFASDSGSQIWGLATVPDDWINQLKTYRKITLEDSETALMYIMTLALFIELLVARTGDLLDEKERDVVEKKTLDTILDLFKITNFDSLKDAKGADEKAEFVLKTMKDVINNSKKEQGKNGYTIPEIYTQFFVNSHTFGKKIPKDILAEYVKSKIGLFEEQDFRNKLV